VDATALDRNAKRAQSPKGKIAKANLLEWNPRMWLKLKAATLK